MTDFETWWHNEGSRPPRQGLDLEEHTKEMCKIAWENGMYKEREEMQRLENIRYDND